ncbi:ATP synthase subunit I [uncultured Gimesia sp.]|jgi:F1F0 ATPase subunit 2|uniref:ATP synthase subunit I n=1 Tax=uncultured Gimesia sp. TaxID=1678688 RepID=UPI0026167968|nr:ATP synthase subunit I [uncultured Gimesia sp.]
MNTNLITQLILSLVVGMLLGAIFFGGLWMTVKNLQKVSWPWLLFLVSALSRTVIALSGFWFVGIWLSATNQWQRMAGCLLGFMIARHLYTRQIRMENVSLSRSRESL